MSRQRPRLVALGDLLLDVVIRPDRTFERGTDVPGDVSFRRGGSAANTAVAFARAGGSASLITSLGEDGWAPRLSAAVRRDAVRVHAVRRAGASGRLAVIVDERGERSFITDRGAADLIRPDDIQGSWLRGADVLHLPAYSLFDEPIGASSLRAAELAGTLSLLISTDLSSTRPLLTFGIGRARARFAEMGPDVLFANRLEAAAMLEQTGRRAWAGLLVHAPLVVVKDGAWGCRVLWRGTDRDRVRQLDVAAERMAAHVDTTGAGDAFAAGFLFSLIGSGGRDAMTRDKALRHAAEAGHRAAAGALRRGRPELQPG